MHVLVQEMQHFTINALLNVLLQKYFVGYKCIHYIGNGSLDFSQTTEGVTVIVDKIDSINEVQLRICDAFVVHVDDPVEVFTAIEWQMGHRKTDKYSFRRYLFITNKDLVDSFLLVGYTKHVFDLLIVATTHNKDVFDLYYTRNVYNELRMVLVNKWRSCNNTFVKNGTLFPDKINKQNFYVGTFNFPPYVILDSMAGIELKVLVEYCKRNNLILKVRDFGDGNWGQINENFTGTKLIGCVTDQLCHVGVAGFYWQTKKPIYLDYVMPVVKIATNCIVPIPTMETSWLIAFLPFDLETWLSIFAAVFMFAVAWKLVARLFHSKQTNVEIFFTLLALVLQQPNNLQHTLRIYKDLRRIFIPALVLMLLISVAYPSILFKLMRHPSFSKPIYDVDTLQESGISWGTIHKSYVDMLPQEKYEKLLKRLVIADEKDLLQLLKKKDFAMVIEHLNKGHVVPTTISLYNFMTMKSDMFWIWGTMLLPINSVWQPSLQQHTQLVHEAGLNEFWEKEAFHVMGLAKYHRQLEAHTSFKLNSINLWQVRGVFLIWAFGAVVSLAAFIVEIWQRNATPYLE